MTYPKPDRSHYTPRFHKTTDNPHLDIGWAEGQLTDGRPYRMEAWCEEGITAVTFFFAVAGLEQLTSADFPDLLEREELLRYATARRSAYAVQVTDPSGNRIWSVNVVIGVEDAIYAGGGPTLKAYGRG